MREQLDAEERYCAEITVYSSTLPAAEFSRLLSGHGTARDRARSPVPGKVSRIPRSHITFASRLEKGENAVAQIDDVCAVVAPVADQIATLLAESDDLRGRLCLCASTTGLRGGLSATKEHVRFAARLGLSIDIEYTAFGAVDDDDVSAEEYEQVIADEVYVETRCSASIEVYSSTLEQAELTERLAGQGTVWARAVPRAANGGQRSPRSGIQFASRLEESEDSSAQIDDVLAVVEPIAEQITTLLRDRDDCWGTLVIWAHTTGWLGALGPTDEQVQLAARLGLGMAVDYAASGTA